MFHELGLVEQWGSGVQRMIATCREAGLASPVWEEVGLRLRVTIYTAVTDSPVTDTAGAATGHTIDATDQSILTLLQGGGEHGTAEVATAIGLSARATRTRLVKLVSLGLIREVGTGPNDPKRRYIAGRALRG